MRHACYLLALWLPGVACWASAADLVATPEQLNRQGVELFRQGHPEAAIDPLKQALQASPYQSTLRNNLAAAYLAAGHAALLEHRYRDAAELLLEGRGYDADEPRFWLFRAEALVQLRDFPAAEIDLQEARSLVRESQRVPLLKLLGKVYDQTGRVAEAVETWREALALDPADQDLAQALQRAERAYRYESGLASRLGGQFLLHFDAGSDAEISQQILDALQEAYAEVGSLFGVYPEEQISVLVYTSREFSAVTASPGWAGGAYDGKIRLSLGGLRELTPAARAMLYHEYTHVVVGHLTHGHCPTWLNEGLAEAVSSEQFSHPLRVLPAAAREQRLFGFEQLTGSLRGLQGEQAVLAYEQSASFVRFLSERYGWYTLVDVLESLGRGGDLERALAVAAGEQGLSLGQLERQWQERLAD